MMWEYKSNTRRFNEQICAKRDFGDLGWTHYLAELHQCIAHNRRDFAFAASAQLQNTRRKTLQKDCP
jgi:hypothetical protein